MFFLFLRRSGFVASRSGSLLCPFGSVSRVFSGGDCSAVSCVPQRRLQNRAWRSVTSTYADRVAVRYAVCGHFILLRCYSCGRFLPCHLTNFAVHACCAQVVFHPTCDSIGACHGCWKSSSKFFKVSLRTKLNRFALPEKFHEVLKVFSQGQIQQPTRLFAGSAGSWALASAHCLSANRPAAPTTTNCRSAGTLILEQVPRTCLLSDLQAPGHMTRCAPTLGSRVELGHNRSRTDVDCNKPIQPICAQVGFSFAEAWDRGTRLPGTRRIPHSQRRSWL